MRFYFDVGWWIRAGLKEGAQRSQVKEVVLVVNYNAPDHLEDYVHRIGRTGRAGNTGFAYTLITREEADKANDLVDALRSSGETPPPELLVLAEEHQQKVNMGLAKKRSKWGGFGGKAFKFDNSEKSRQQQDRAAAKKELNLGDSANDAQKKEDLEVAFKLAELKQMGEDPEQAALAQAAATVNSAKSAVDAAAAAAANLGKAPPEVRPAFSAYLILLMHQAEFLLRSLD
jgi:ATP-dependent RNA helicase DDX46/PRP5